MSGRHSPGTKAAVPRIVGGSPGQWQGVNGERGALIPFFRGAVPTANYETIWPGVGEFQYLAAPATVSLVTDPADDGKTIEISYLTTDYVPRPPVTLITNAATPPTIDNFLRLLRMRTTIDLGARLTADASLETGGTTYGLIAAGGSINKIASFTFPAGSFGSVCCLFVNLPAGKSVSIRLQKREVLTTGPGAAWEDLLTLEDVIEGTHLIPFCEANSAWSGLKSDPGTDIQVQALAGGVNQSVSGYLSVISQPIPGQYL